MMHKPVTLQEVEYLAHRLARELLAFNEPIPEFATRRAHILEGCLVAPFQSFGGRSLYQSFNVKAAAFFYLMIKDHPFQNGNKRIAMTSLLVLLHKNGMWLKADMKELYNFTMWVAESPASFKTEVVQAAEKFIRTHIVDERV